jgi:hypothetical protein
MGRYVVVTDMPGIKQFIFADDTLAEIRGASALLDRLNREDTPHLLKKYLQRSGASLIQTVFANAGTGQFLVEANDSRSIDRAIDMLSSDLRTLSEGEVRLAYGLATFESTRDYHQAVAEAHARLRRLRETGDGHCAVTLMPLMMECESLSHLPAEGRFAWGQESRFLSAASRLKRAESRESRREGAWAEWMVHLAKGDRRLSHVNWERLRPRDFEDIGEASSRSGYIGLVYADGNAMGRLVQELDDADTAGEFSRIVDSCIRHACYTALEQVLAAEVQVIREASQDHIPSRLPADILLLGGDDMLVVLPADRALCFAQAAMQQFTEAARKEIAKLGPPVRTFFEERLPPGHGPTISCGVAFGRDSYPFYLLLDLAEELLRQAKGAGSEDLSKTEFWAPGYLDFHLISGAASHELEAVRRDVYQIATNEKRTTRPLSLEKLGSLRQAVGLLRAVSFPPSKLHDLFEAATVRQPATAEYRAREIFSRCGPKQREALWEALVRLGGIHSFPWSQTREGSRMFTALADLAEAYYLLPANEGNAT